MKFNSTVKMVGGDAIPPNSVALLYSPHCGHCHKIVPQFNALSAALSAGGVNNVKIVAVDVSQEFSSLRAGGISVPHVPLVLIKTPTSIIEYQGTRMATEIASEAAKVLAGGESVPTTVPETVPSDALLGGASPIVGGAAPVEGGKTKFRRKSPSKRRGYRSPHRYLSGVDRSASRVRKLHSVQRGGRRFMRMSARRSASSIRKSRSKPRKSRKLRAGDAPTEVQPIAGGELEGGSGELEGGKKKYRSRNKHHLYNFIEGHYPSGAYRGSKRRRHMVDDYHVRGHESHSRSGKRIYVKAHEVRGKQTSRRSASSIRRSRAKKPRMPYRSRAVRGGEDVPAPIAGGDVAPVVPIVGGDVAPVVPIVGGDAPAVPVVVEGGAKRRRSRSRKSGSRTAWQRVMSTELKKHSRTRAGFKAAVHAAQKKYHA